MDFIQNTFTAECAENAEKNNYFSNHKGTKTLRRIKNLIQKAHRKGAKSAKKDFTTETQRTQRNN